MRVDDTGKNMQLICFVVYGSNTILTLFVYCYIGECLIQESINFGEAFYDCEWKSSRYTLIAVPTMAASLLLYYTNNMITGIETTRDNSSAIIHLPYRARVFVDLHDTRIYCFCALCQLVSVAIVVFGYVGLDCLFVTIAFHITAQLKILRCSINNVLENNIDFRSTVKKLVIKHYRLIRLSETLENDFNMIIFQQLLGTVIHICISIYNWTVVDIHNTRQSLVLMCFMFYGFNTIGTLFIYCYIGEGLINESMNFGEAFYHYEWCNISPLDLKLLQICMVRARKPLKLTSGKFCDLSLCTFTNTLKATMGYFSVLRNFL
ncbi:hypothetical protein KPH14_002615 [Odynerus spinipes]|uniref:Odorant receptor n=2 Tax=Odynerus spinipes TaxID=1348599 RepID=A0AAD9VHP9_9HYME|nr:hypothetical protein KPH14_002615 [Odynerus spinipes]